MVKESAVSDDFTFPTTITDNSSSLCHLHISGFAASSFWYVPKEGDFGFHQTRSFSAMGGGKRSNHRLTRDLGLLYSSRSSFSGIYSGRFGGEDEDKMDMLWEDFNDEDQLSLPSPDEKDAEGPDGAFSDMMNFCESNVDREKVLAEGSKASKCRSLLPHRRVRPSLLVMLKILKKLFLIHSSHSCPRKRTSMVH